MKTASEIRQITSEAGNHYIEQWLEPVKEYIDSKIEENSRKGLYSALLQAVKITDDILVRDQIVQNLRSHYHKLGFSFYVHTLSGYFIYIEIGWEESLWQKFKKFWSKK